MEENKEFFAEKPNSPVSSSDMGAVGKVWEIERSGSSGEALVVQGGYIYTFGEDSGIYEHELVITKWFPNGTLVWEKIFSEEFYRGKRSAWGDGTDLYITGQERTTYDKFLTKINSSGDIVYTSKSDYFGGSIWGNEEFLYVSGWHSLSKVDPSNGSIVESYNLPEEALYAAYYLWGNGDNLYTLGDNGDEELFLVKWGLDGNILWSTYVGSGRSKDLSGDGEYLYVLLEDKLSKWSFEGISIWNNTIEDIVPESFSIDEKGIYVAGATDEFKSQLSLAGYGLDGSFLWEKSWRTKDYGNQKLYDVAFGKNQTLYTLGSGFEIILTKWVQDTIEPILNDINDDIRCEQTDGVFFLNWYAYDENPDFYTVSRDNYIVESGSWISGETISVQVNKSSALGGYNYSIILTDLSGNMATDSCIVTIEDTTSPRLSCKYANDSNVIVWVAEDRNPSSYSVYTDDEELFSGSWISGEEISIVASPDKKSSLNYTIVVRDTSGNLNSHSVIVPALSGTTTSPLFSWWEVLLVLVGIAFIATITILVVLIKKNHLVLREKVYIEN